MATFIDRLVELLGVLVVAYAANDSFRAAVLLAVALLGALAGLALRTYAQPGGDAPYSVLHCVALTGARRACRACPFRPHRDDPTLVTPGDPLFRPLSHLTAGRAAH